MNEYENSGELFFSFPRAFVFSRSHAPLFFLVPTRRRGNAFSTPQCRGPQARKDGMLARPESVPTPARGNQKKMGRWRVPNRFPRRRVGTRNPAYCRGEPACSPSFVIARKRNLVSQMPINPFLYTILVVLGRHYYLNSQPITNQR